MSARPGGLPSAFGRTWWAAWAQWPEGVLPSPSDTIN